MPIIGTLASASARGYGLFSSTAVPFTLTGSYDALATVTVPSGGASSITFSAIPQTGYSHLQIRAIAHSGRTSSTNDYYTIRFNNDSGSSNYYIDHKIYGDGSTATSNADGSGSLMVAPTSVASSDYSSSLMGASIIDILDYTSLNKNKVLKILNGVDNNGSGIIGLASAMWMPSTPAAVNSITIGTSNSSWNFTQYSQFSLYGIR
jgi:hypothetical protein